MIIPDVIADVNENYNGQMSQSRASEFGGALSCTPLFIGLVAASLLAMGVNTCEHHRRFVV